MSCFHASAIMNNAAVKCKHLQSPEATGGQPLLSSLEPAQVSGARSHRSLMQTPLEADTNKGLCLLFFHLLFKLFSDWPLAKPSRNRGQGHLGSVNYNVAGPKRRGQGTEGLPPRLCRCFRLVKDATFTITHFVLTRLLHLRCRRFQTLNNFSRSVLFFQDNLKSLNQIFSLGSN